MDTATSAEIMDLLASLNTEGMTILMITHSPELAGRARRRVRIVDGRLIEHPG